ncbi:unnamed protein product [Phaeothamnion confervicola]
MAEGAEQSPPGPGSVHGLWRRHHSSDATAAAAKVAHWRRLAPCTPFTPCCCEGHCHRCQPPSTRSFSLRCLLYLRATSERPAAFGAGCAATPNFNSGAYHEKGRGIAVPPPLLHRLIAIGAPVPKLKHRMAGKSAETVAFGATAAGKILTRPN